MKLRVSLYEGDGGEWDDFVRGQPTATHCHRFGWKRIVEAVLGHQPIYLAARGEGGGLEGVLPLVHMRSTLFGNYLVSMPFLNYGGPLGTREAVAALTTYACELARRQRVRRLEFRSRTELPVGLTAAAHKVSATLELPSGGADPLWAAFSGKLRSQIRRCEKEGVCVRFGADQVHAFHHVFSTHMTHLGTPTYPAGLFAEIASVFGPDAWVGCVYLGEEPIAAGFGLRWRSEVEMTWASALLRFSRIAPNMLLYWSFLRRAAEEGLRSFDFGRCTPGSGSHRFKQQWGPAEVPLRWYSYSPSGRTGSTSSDLAVGSWAPRVWRRLPVPLARIVGPPIRRAIPL